MATKIVYLKTTQDPGLYGPETPHALCPIHGRKIYTTTGEVNLTTCDICGEIVGYGGCGGCIGTNNHQWCDICGRDYCKKHGGGVSMGGLRMAFMCNKCRRFYVED